MELDRRKMQVLHAIIKKYILTGEPVGSRTISKDPELGVSSATIRNEMSDLEDMGLILQPYTSAGRVPSDKGYRFYVNQVLPSVGTGFSLSMEGGFISKEINHIEGLLKEVTRTLSENTSYTAIVLAPRSDNPKIKKIQLVLIDKLKIMILLISDTKVIQSDIFKLEDEMTEDEIGIINNFLNTRLQGKKIDEVQKDLDVEVLRKSGNAVFVKKLVPIIVSTLESQQKRDIYFEGVSNALDFLEHTDMNKAKRFLEFIEDKENLINLLSDGEVSDIEVKIGSENPQEEMKGLTLVKSVYSVNGDSIGKIGLVGPTRMDYLKVMCIIKSVTEDLNKIIRKYMLE